MLGTEANILIQETLDIFLFYACISPELVAKVMKMMMKSARLDLELNSNLLLQKTVR